MDSEEFKVGFSTLEVGVLYPIVCAVRTEGNFHGRVTKGIKVVILDGELELTTYLPKKTADFIDDVKFKNINDAGQTEQKWCVCYYGKLVGAQISQFIGRVHPPGERPFSKLLSDVGKVMAKYGEKRKSSEDVDAGSSKVVKLD